MPNAPVPDEVKLQRAVARKNKGGRPTSLTKDTFDTIVNAVRRGHYIEMAAAMVEVDTFTVRHWLKRGARSKTGIYKEFNQAIKKAMAEDIDRTMQFIDQAAVGYPSITKRVVQKRNKLTGKMEVVESSADEKIEKSWAAAAWKLERKYPRLFGRWQREEFEETLPDAELNPKEQIEGPAVVQADDSDPDRLAELIGALVDVNILPAAVTDLITEDDDDAIDVTPEDNGNGSGHIK